MTREEAIKEIRITIEYLKNIGVIGNLANDGCEEALQMAIKALEQEPRKGHWICDGKGRSFADYHCSECGLKLALCGQDIKQRQDSGYSLFCGGCGADMRESEE